MPASNPDTPRDELLHRLQRGIEQLHEARLEWEHWLDATEFRHQERVDAAWQKLQQIEHDVEALEQQIKTTFDQHA